MWLEARRRQNQASLQRIKVLEAGGRVSKTCVTCGAWWRKYATEMRQVVAHLQLRRQVGLGARLDLYLGRAARLADMALLVMGYRVLL